METVRESVVSVRRQGASILERCDQEGEQAMRTTLQILEEKLHTLEATFQDTENQLQVGLPPAPMCVCGGGGGYSSDLSGT